MTKSRLEKLYVMLWELDTEDKIDWTGDEYKMLNHVTLKILENICHRYYKNQTLSQVKTNLLLKYLPKEKK